MGTRKSAGVAGAGRGLANPVLVGSVIIVTLLVAVFLSYNANRGLPFVPTYDLRADVPDAAELVAGSEVRIGGYRVGKVTAIEAVSPDGDRKPFARLELKLDSGIDRLPRDTTVRVRPRSLLGAKYLELTPGASPEVFEAGQTLPLSSARQVTEIDETFQIFDAKTTRGLQGTIRGVGGAVAGRGSAINQAIAATNALLGPLRNVSDVLAAPDTQLARFNRGLGATMGALAPVTGDLVGLLRAGSVTLAALDRPALDQTIAALPGTATEAAGGLRAATPLMRELGDLAQALEPGVSRLPRTTRELTLALETGTRTLARTRRLTRPLRSTLTRLDAVTTDRRTPAALAGLTETLTQLEPTVTDLTAAQVACNTAALGLTNLAGVLRRGDSTGGWLSVQLVFGLDQMLRSPRPAGSLNYNPYPIQSASECEAGNEPFRNGQQIGNPDGAQSTSVPRTTPPDGALGRARDAGLLAPIEGAPE